MKNSSDKVKDYGRAILMGVLLGISLALVFCGGFFLRDLIDLPPALAVPRSSQDDAEGYPLLDEVQVYLDNHYLRQQPVYTARQYAAIRGVLSALGDRNTFFIEPSVAASESHVLAGTYGGIGVTLQRAASGEFVLFPFPDGPAARAGIEDNDILREVNGAAVDLTLGQDTVDQMLRGEVAEGSGVEITVYRPSADDEITLFILFEVINIPSVLWRVLAEDSQIGYIQILRFTNRTPEELQTAVAELRQAEVAALVLDLRNNGGGLLQEAIQVAGEFLDGGVVLYEVTRDGERNYTAEEGGSLTDLPLVVLVNGGTASASELVAGAIQDRQRGILVGQRTYGKGTIQQIFALSDGSSIHVTSAEWFTPNRHVIDGVGLEPDIVMIPDESGRDIELVEAVHYLQQQRVIQGSTP